MIKTLAVRYGFNPTLVRLRPKCYGLGDESCCLFQSHAGSIEARTDQGEIVDVSPVSIPRWFD